VAGCHCLEERTQEERSRRAQERKLRNGIQKGLKRNSGQLFKETRAFRERIPEDSSRKELRETSLKVKAGCLTFSAKIKN